MEYGKENQTNTYQKMTKEEARKILEIGPYVTQHDVRQAYKRKAQESYPRDLINSPEVILAFQKLSIAYRRLAYDLQIKEDLVELPVEHEFKIFRQMFEDERHVVHVHTEHGSFLVLGKRYSHKRSSNKGNDDDFDASHYSFQKQAGPEDSSESAKVKTKADKKKLKKQRQRENKRQAKENLQKQREEIKQERQKIAEESKIEQAKKATVSEGGTVDSAANDPTKSENEAGQSGKASDPSVKSKEVKGKNGQKKHRGNKERANSKDSGNKSRKDMKTEEGSKDKPEGEPRENTEREKALHKPASKKQSVQSKAQSNHQAVKKSAPQAQTASDPPSNQSTNVEKPAEFPLEKLGKKLKDPWESDSDKDGETADSGEIDVECAFFAKSVKTVQKKASATKSGKVVVNGSLKKPNATSTAPQKVVEEKSKTDGTEEIVHKFATEANAKGSQGKFNEAAALFTRAILLDSTNFLLYANRSFCYEQLSEFDKALRDAERAVSFSPQWSKGYFRKGRALVGLKRYKDAEKAFEQVLRLDKSNHDADNELYHTRVKRLEEIGFSKQQSVLAIRKYITVDEALENMLAGSLSEAAVEDVYVSDDEDLVAPVPEIGDLSLQGSSPDGTGTSERDDAAAAMPFGDTASSLQSNSTDTTQSGGSMTQNPNSMTSEDPKPRQVDDGYMKSVPASARSDMHNSGKNQQKRDQCFAVWIGNITRKITETILDDYFIQFGPIRSIRLHYDRQYAFVNYINPESAPSVLEAHTELDLHGHHLYLNSPGNRFVPNRLMREPVNIGRGGSDFDGYRHEGRMYPRGGDVPPRHVQNRFKTPINDFRRECHFWRRGGCIHGPDCKFLHIPAHQGIDGV